METTPPSPPPSKSSGFFAFLGKLLDWAGKAIKGHPLASSLAALVILALLTITVGSVNQTDFINVLLVLVTIAGGLYFTFFPAPSAIRGLAAIVIAILVSSIVLNKPLELRTDLPKLWRVARASLLARVELPSATPPTSQPSIRPLLATTALSTPGTYASVGCGQTQSASVEVTLPPDAIDVTYSARWVDLSNIKSSTQSARQEGQRLIATGTITGLDRQYILGIPNCPGGGHATLVLTGSYKTRGS